MVHGSLPFLTAVEVAVIVPIMAAIVLGYVWLTVRALVPVPAKIRKHK